MLFQKKFFFFILFFSFPFFVFADSLGEKNYFFLDQNYDLFSRKKVLAKLIRISQNAYFYLEDEWWQGLSEDERNKVANYLFEISEEFDTKIYPNLASLFGSEAKPGIDNDEKITILFHRAKKGVGGYFREKDGYSREYFLDSNQREMIYLNLDEILQKSAESRIAHELVHLITFNQKNILLNLEEETWLNEMRAEIAPTILGYKEYVSSRIDTFLQNPTDSIVDWEGKAKDYGVLSLFGHYILDHYGIKIFTDSLREKSIGILSVNSALRKNNFSEDFVQIFKNFLIALYLNDCSFGEKFCFKTENLKNVKVVPQLNLLPQSTESTLTIYQQAKDFAPNFQKIVGGKGNLNLEFEGQSDGKFELVLLVCSNSANCEIKDLQLNRDQKGKFFLEDFDKKYSSLVLISFPRTRTSGFDEEKKDYNFSFTVSFGSKIKQEKIVEKKQEVRFSCSKIDIPLKIGMSGNLVKCLQEILKSQGKEIYPEGLVTGYFGPLTKAAVIRFQEKYKDEILKPLGLKKGTGFVGPLTRQKLNQLLK